jgi:hypothetical protein
MKPSPTAISDTIAGILNDHFDATIHPFITNLTSDWKQADDNQGLKNALMFLHKAINSKPDQLSLFLKQEFGSDTESQEIRRHLSILSKSCNGDIGNNPRMIAYCQRFSNAQNQELKEEISAYLKKKCGDYLEKNYSHTYSLVKREVESESTQNYR